MNRLGAIQHAVKRQVGEHVSLRAVRAASVGTADHTVIAGANVLFTLVVARYLGPSSFGEFALLFMVVMFFGTVHEALVTTPHTVISASKQGGEYPRYTSSVAVFQGAFALATGSVLLAAAGVSTFMSPEIVTVLLALSLASVTTQTQSFTYRVLYAESRFGAALLNNSFTNSVRLLLLGALILTAGITITGLFLVIGVSFAAGTILGLWQIRRSLTLAFDRGVIREHWTFGHWLCASRIVSQLPDYLTAGLLSSALSVSAFGAYRAANQIVHGATLPLRVLDSLLRPKLARDAQFGAWAVWRTIRPILVVGGVMFSILALVLMVLRSPLLDLIYGSEYAPYASVMLLLAIKPLGTLLKEVLSNALLAFHLTRAIFFRAIVSAIVGSSLGSVAILAFGLPAAGAISVIGTAASVVWLGTAWKQQLQSANSITTEPYRVPETSVSR